MANFYVIVEINDPRNGGKGRWEGWERGVALAHHAKTRFCNRGRWCYTSQCCPDQW